MSPAPPHTRGGDSPDWTDRAVSRTLRVPSSALPECPHHARDDPLPAERPGHHARHRW
jgi:hypothetical protein